MTRSARRRPDPPSPPRVVTAVPLCDGHDSAITTINVELVRRGCEVIYLGYHQPASNIARAAVQEDARAVGISSYNGGHAVFFKEVVSQLRARGAREVRVFGGGGGTITPSDARAMKRFGVDRIFFPGTPLSEIAETLARAASRPAATASLRGDRALGRALTLAESGSPRTVSPRRRAAKRRGARIGVAGPGGAGKSTLIDELVSRFLRRRPSARVAVLASDPSRPAGDGALLGDRVSAIYAQDERVFFRSFATRGSLTGLSNAVPRALDVLDESGEFELVFVESVGVGQESDPFASFGPSESFVDVVLFVLSPHYGGRIQLEKIALLERADLVVLNKCDDPRSTTARSELGTRLSRAGNRAPLLSTIAAEHEDLGVDTLHDAILRLAGVP